jgi:hypothetical protein
VLTLERVSEAIADYPDHHAESDVYFRQANDDYEAFRECVRAEYPDVHRRFKVILQNAQAFR